MTPVFSLWPGQVSPPLSIPACHGLWPKLSTNAPEAGIPVGWDSTDCITSTPSGETLSPGGRHPTWVVLSSILCPEALELHFLLVVCQSECMCHTPHCSDLGIAARAQQRLPAEGADTETHWGQNQNEEITWCLQYRVIAGIYEGERSLIKCFQKS